jgi:hypothetical protein
VFACPGNLDAVKSQEGQTNGCFGAAPGGLFNVGTNYYEETIGLNWKPEVPKSFEGMVVRPEVRWDWSSHTTPFDDGTSHWQATVGADVVIPVAF